jgi:hypothetical protein
LAFFDRMVAYITSLIQNGSYFFGPDVEVLSWRLALLEDSDLRAFENRRLLEPEPADDDIRNEKRFTYKAFLLVKSSNFLKV